jgi:hypothetical protein
MLPPTSCSFKYELKEAYITPCYYHFVDTSLIQAHPGSLEAQMNF